MSAAKEAASTLRRIAATLALPPGVAAYVRGYADGLERRRRARLSQGS